MDHHTTLSQRIIHGSFHHIGVNGSLIMSCGYTEYGPEGRMVVGIFTLNLSPFKDELHIKIYESTQFKAYVFGNIFIKQKYIA